MNEALDLDVRREIYEGFLTTGRALTIGEIARRLGRRDLEVGEALQRLAGAHALVLQPASGDVLMANPFSAVPTAFVVSSAGRSWWGNCIWDGLGILAMLGADGSVATACPDCGEALTLSVRNGRVDGDSCLAHFAVPARSWWDDVVFT